MAAALSGTVHGIVLSGGLAASARLTGWLRDRVSFLGPMLIYPGEHELQGLPKAP